VPTLLASVAALLVGPALWRLVGDLPGLRRALDWIVIGSVTALVVLAILPDAVEAGSLVVIVVAALGLLLPSTIEYFLHRSDRHRIENWAHMLTLSLSLAGLAMHATVEGAVIGRASDGTTASALIPLAVVIHRVPVGLTVWWLLRPLGRYLALAVLAGIVTGTVAGYVVGSPIVNAMSGGQVVAFQAFVAGMLLHVVFFRQHAQPHEPHSPPVT
jgi:hypothetical protein